MTKWIVAAAMLLTTAFATMPRAASNKAEEIATGTCSYTCSSNGKTYINGTQCRSHCAGVCTAEVC